MYDQTSTYEPDANEHGSRLDPVLARSWLLVNGAQFDRFSPATRSSADIVIIATHTGHGDAQDWEPSELQENTAQFLTTMVDGVDIQADGSYGALKETGEWNRVGAIWIDNNECIRCGACFDVCPTRCISIVRKEFVTVDV